MPDYSSIVRIEELNVGGGKQPRVVVLTGAGLPFQGAKWGGKNIIPTTWYPGNGDEATQQVLGPQELPSSWDGEWRRTQLPKSRCTIQDSTGTVRKVISPVELREALETIFREGARLRVTWRQATVGGGGQDDSIVREGRAEQWEFPHDRAQDIKWNITFVWVSRGKRVQRPIETRSSSLAPSTAGLAADLDGILSLTDQPIFSSNPIVRASASTFSLGQLERMASYPVALTKSFVRSIQRILNSVRKVSDVALAIRNMPLNIANAAVDGARNTVAQCNAFVDLWGRNPPELNTLSSNVSDMLRATRSFGRIADAAAVAARRARDLEEQMRTVVNAQAALRGNLSTRRATNTRVNDIAAVHVTKTGDTPITLSIRYYKTADHGGDILRANRLPWHQSGFTPGKVLIIPVLSNVGATSQSGA